MMGKNKTIMTVSEILRYLWEIKADEPKNYEREGKRKREDHYRGTISVFYQNSRKNAERGDNNFKDASIRVITYEAIGRGSRKRGVGSTKIKEPEGSLQSQ